MCNAKALLTTVAIGGALYTGGASLGLLGGEAAAGAGAGIFADTAATTGISGLISGAVAPGAAALTTAQATTLGLSAASTGLAAYGAFQQATVQKDVAARNAAVSGMQAADATRRGDLAAIDANRQGSVIQGQQRAALASRGLDLSEGTPNDILGQSDFFTQSNAATARTNGRREAWSDLAQQGNFQAQANASNPGLSTVGSLLGGGSRVADRWYQFHGG